MYRTKDWGGMLLAHVTLALILYGVYMANRTYIFYWHQTTNVKDMFVQGKTNSANLTLVLGIPLTGKGFFYFLTFNGASVLAILTH